MRISLKYVYILVVLGGSLALFWMTQGGQDDAASSLPSDADQPQHHKAQPQNASLPTPCSSTAVSPVFEGVDEKGKPYTVRADCATRDPQSSDIHLKNPQYTAQTNDNEPVTIHAQKGILNEEQKRLTLMDHVELRYRHDTVLHVPHMVVSTDTGYVEGTARNDRVIYGKNPKLTLRTNRMEVYDRGKTIVMHDHPTLTFRMK